MGVGAGVHVGVHADAHAVLAAPVEDAVVLVNFDDVEIGTAAKLAAHRRGVLHRAVSVFVFDGAGGVLLQRRAAGKYHCGGLWSNTACGHPRPGESPAAAAARRLRAEMGIGCTLERVGTVRYHLSVDGGMTEHEFDHVFVGRSSATPRPDPSEVGEWRRVPVAWLRGDLARHPRCYTPWLPVLLETLDECGPWVPACA